MQNSVRIAIHSPRLIKHLGRLTCSNTNQEILRKKRGETRMKRMTRKQKAIEFEQDQLTLKSIQTEIVFWDNLALVVNYVHSYCHTQLDALQARVDVIQSKWN